MQHPRALCIEGVIGNHSNHPGTAQNTTEITCLKKYVISSLIKILPYSSPSLTANAQLVQNTLIYKPVVFMRWYLSSRCTSIERKSIKNLSKKNWNTKSTTDLHFGHVSFSHKIRNRIPHSMHIGCKHGPTAKRSDSRQHISHSKVSPLNLIPAWSNRFWKILTLHTKGLRIY